MVKFSDLAEIMDGQILHLHQDLIIRFLATDSRQLIVHPETIFFAIKGPNHDGHRYFDDVLEMGIANFVVQNPVADLSPRLLEANVIAVDSVIRALQAFAEFHRSQFTIPVLGVTGSNAKTIIKEWLFQLLDDKVVVKSPKSYNSQIGVPLSVWQLNQTASMAIFEAGISKNGEMENLARMIQPTIGIFTNIGTAHDAGFTDTLEKIHEKSLLFQEAEVIIYRRDHQLVHQVLSRSFPKQRLLGWSTEGLGTNRFSFEDLGSEVMCSWDFITPGKALLPFSDPASLENAMHCIVFLLTQGYHPNDIDKKVRLLQNIPHRLALMKGINNCFLIDDTYNNDMAGLVVALDFLNQQPHGKERTLILSDIQQASGPAEELYHKVADGVKSYNINRFIGIGKDLLKYQNFFPSNSLFFTNTDAFHEWWEPNRFSDQLLLIKGARDFSFERIVQLLLDKHHGTVLEINLDALTHNLNFFRKQIHDNTRIMVMVKAFAYGTGSHEVANLLQYHGIDYLGVAYCDEGVTLRKNDIHIPIMVMNPSPEDFELLLNYRLEPEIYSLQLLRSFQDFCRKRKVTHTIHLKLDTGMHRLGFQCSEIGVLAEQWAEYPLPIASVFSHLAAADDLAEKAFTKSQIQSFEQATDTLESLTASPFVKHILNSAGIRNYPDYQMDMVRLGIGLYGIGNDKSLRSISTLKTTISQINQLKKGDTVGYGRLGVIKRDSKIATIAIGYADGFDRRFGNGVGKVLVGEELAPVIGNVCMDMTMIDVTDCKASVGDQVVIFNHKLTIQQLAESIDTIAYELLTKVSERVKRVYYLE